VIKKSWPLLWQEKSTRNSIFFSIIEIIFKSLNYDQGVDQLSQKILAVQMVTKFWLPLFHDQIFLINYLFIFAFKTGFKSLDYNQCVDWLQPKILVFQITMKF